MGFVTYIFRPAICVAKKSSAVMVFDPSALAARNLTLRVTTPTSRSPRHAGAVFVTLLVLPGVLTMRPGLDPGLGRRLRVCNGPVPQVVKRPVKLAPSLGRIIIMVQLHLLPMTQTPVASDRMTRLGLQQDLMILLQTQIRL